jgi:hypothetical protein
VLDKLVAVEGTEVRLRVANVHRQEHAPIMVGAAAFWALDRDGPGAPVRGPATDMQRAPVSSLGR